MFPNSLLQVVKVLKQAGGQPYLVGGSVRDMALNVEPKDLDLEVKSKEGALLRFRTQQAEVKKNDEYQALTHQIEQAEADISSIEEREIELMLDIDTAKEEFETEKAAIQVRIEAQRQEIDLLTQREKNLDASVDKARSEVAESRVGVVADYMEQYDRVVSGGQLQVHPGFVIGR